MSKQEFVKSVTCSQCGTTISYTPDLVKIIVYNYTNPIKKKTIRAVCCPKCNNEQEIN